jgi:hyperosmotically inducible periplasmic protein
MLKLNQGKRMKKQIAGTVLVLALAMAPAVLTFNGCAVTQGKETAGQYAKDKEIAARIKTALYADPTTKGTEVEVQALQGNVQLSGFVSSQAAKDRASQIASSVPGVLQVYNNLIVPTGR